MGVRLYNPTTGRFLSVDPIAGGNANPYEYCSGDPVNCYDLDGRQGWRKKAWNWTKRNWRNGNIVRWAGYTATGACVVLSAGACTVAAGVAFGVSAARRAHKLGTGGRWRKGKEWARFAGGVALDLGSARVPGIRYVKRVYRPRHGVAGYRPRTHYHSLRSSLRTRTGWRNAAGVGVAAAWNKWGWS
jgi:hypothetical protein